MTANGPRKNGNRRLRIKYLKHGVLNLALSGEVNSTTFSKKMNEREQEKLKVKKILRSHNSTGEDIKKALTDYFKNYTVNDIIETERPELSTVGLSTATEDILEIFDGGLF